MRANAVITSIPELADAFLDEGARALRGGGARLGACGGGRVRLLLARIRATSAFASFRSRSAIVARSIWTSRVRRASPSSRSRRATSPVAVVVA